MGVKIEDVLLIRGLSGWFPLIGQGDIGLHKAPVIGVDVRGLRRLWHDVSFHGRWCPERMGLGSWAPFWAQRNVLQQLAVHQRWGLSAAPMDWGVAEVSLAICGIGVEVDLAQGALRVTPVVGAPGKHDVPALSCPLIQGPPSFTLWQDWLFQQAPTDQAALRSCWSRFCVDLKLNWPAW